MAKISKRSDYGRARTDTSVKKNLMKKTGKDKPLNPLLITLACSFNEGKKITYLQNRFKIRCAYEDFA